MSTIPSINPSTYKVIGEVEAATEQDVINAVQKARAAQPLWAELGLAGRRGALESFIKKCEERGEEIAQTMSQEMGKPIRAARGQVKEGLEYFHVYLELAEKVLEPIVVFEDASQKHTQFREPLGVVAAISPWNFPFLNIPWQVGQALIAGNTVVYKPSEEIVLFAKLIAEIVAASQLPEGVFNVLIGDGTVGEMLVQQPVDAILFTGSTRTGQHITELAAKNSTPVLTEMGGSAPGIVFEDANVDKIIETIYNMRFDNTGQYCDGLKRLLVHENKFDEVLSALKRLNESRKVGDASDENTHIGPLVARRQLDVLEAQVQDALSNGAQIFFGGKKPEGLTGAYYTPTVLTQITFNMRVWREEVFGPVLPVITFKNDDEAVTLANDTMYGLGAFVFTENKERYQNIARKLQSGVVAHNNALYYNPASAFGGVKKSGNSRTNGIEGFYEITQTKVVSEEK